MNNMSKKFWTWLAFVLLAMNLIQLAALYSAVTRLEDYYDENNRLKNRVSFLEHQTNRPYAK
jgi:uncharacterized protein YpmS